MAVLVDLVVPTAKPAADDLLAEQLATEGADAEDVGDGVGIPTLGEHRHAHDAAHLFTELSPLADGVHHLPEELLVSNLFDVRTWIAAAILAL